MADPRNIAHDKKVQEVKKHHHVEPVPAAIATPQPGRKPPLEPAEGEPDGGHESFHQHQQQEEAPADE